MKIIIHSLDELLKLAALLDPRATMREVRIDNKIEFDASSFDPGLAKLVEQHTDCVAAGLAASLRVSESKARSLLGGAGPTEPEGLPTDITQPGPAATNEPCPVATDELPERDADGASYDTRWHSEPKKLTDKGVFRARRGRDNDAYKAWLLEQAVEVPEAAIAADEAGPVATETHALPQDDGNESAAAPQEPGSEPSAAPAEAASAVDLEALIAASQEAALDASDSHVDLLNACRDFTTKHGHPAFTALKAAVAPDGDSGQGKTVQHLTPGERRLLQACIANYPND